MLQADHLTYPDCVLQVDHLTVPARQCVLQVDHLTFCARQCVLQVDHLTFSARQYMPQVLICKSLASENVLLEHWLFMRMHKKSEFMQDVV